MLYIPTSTSEFKHYTAAPLSKGQLYNLDDDRKLGFQFNPEELNWSQETGWIEVANDLAFVRRKPKTFEMDLLYVADPTAPDFEVDNTALPVMSGDVKADVDKLVAELDNWCEPRTDTGRPSRVMIIWGANWSFTGVIMSINPKLTYFFRDLSTRQGMISISFREWEPVK